MLNFVTKRNFLKRYFCTHRILRNKLVIYKGYNILSMLTVWLKIKYCKGVCMMSKLLYFLFLSVTNVNPGHNRSLFGFAVDPLGRFLIP